MPQSLTNFDNALKNDYGPGLRNAINNSNPILTEVSKNEEDIVGRKAVWSVHSGRSASTSNRAELGTLHTADRQRYLAPEDTLKYMYHTIKVSGQAKALTRNDTGAFVRAMESEMRGAETDLKNDLARQIFGQKLTDGSALQSGVIGTLSADPGVGTTLTFANEPTSVLRHFFVGMQLQAINPASGATRAGGPYEVSAVSLTAKTVTITAAADAAIASADYIVRAGSVATSAALTNFGNEINGLRHLISTDNYAGITAASNPVWNAVTTGSSSTGISEVVIDEACETVETDGNGQTPSLYIAEHAQRRKLASMLQTQKRYEGRELTLTAGWKGLQIARGVLVADRYCPSTKLFALTPSELSWFVGLDWSWDEDDGKVLYKALDNSDAVEARFKGYLNLEALSRNAHAVTTLSEPTF